MTFVVTDNCVRCKYTDCVVVCPVDCFHAGNNMLVIDPEECIDCALCVPECPVDAIYAEEDVPDDQQQFFEINATYSKIWPILTVLIEAPADAAEWNGVKNKYAEHFDPGF